MATTRGLCERECLPRSSLFAYTDTVGASALLAAQRTAALRRDDDLQATLLPLLLRNYLEHNLYDQADRLVSKTSFPEGTAANAQLARWYYYIGTT